MLSFTGDIKMSEENVITTIRMKPQTAQQLERMKVLVNAPSASDMIRRSIDFSDMLFDVVLKGGSIIVQDKKGKQKEIMILGVNS